MKTHKNKTGIFGFVLLSPCNSSHLSPLNHFLSCLCFLVIYYFFFIFPLIFDDLKHHSQHCAVVCSRVFINRRSRPDLCEKTSASKGQDREAELRGH